MTSLKQIQANKRNGKLGGVKTQAGKAIARKNAIKHGILTNFTMGEEEDALLRTLEENLIKEYQPVGTMEYFLVQRIAFYMLRLQRCGRIESQYLITSVSQETTETRRVLTEEELCE